MVCPISKNVLTPLLFFSLNRYVGEESILFSKKQKVVLYNYRGSPLTGRDTLYPRGCIYRNSMIYLFQYNTVGSSIYLDTQAIPGGFPF